MGGEQCSMSMRSHAAISSPVRERGVRAREIQCSAEGAAPNY